MGKHAYLIAAHSQFSLLQKLIDTIDHERVDIYVHIDKKVKVLPKLTTNKSKLKYVKRVKVNWGAYSQIKYELNLMKEALNTEAYDYVHIISGVDLPLRSQEEILRFFDENKGKEYVQILDKLSDEAIRKRISKYYLLQQFAGRNESNFTYRMVGRMQRILLKLQGLCKIDRSKGIEVKYGANWVSITGDCAKYILSREKFIKKHFKYSLCADEVYKQTIIWNSKYKENISEDEIRLIDWERGKPYTFKMEDYNELAGSKMLFARKFDENVDNDIIEKIWKGMKTL
ncbi:MAG: glycosyl transferase [Lachnospiraceae bacterium]|nr:glycosyl transferase [Lachnospiraceae bacterium]